MPLVSTACDGPCKHNVDSLVHEIGNSRTLRRHLTLLYEQPEELARLRAGALASRYGLTWTAAGEQLLSAYRDGISRYHLVTQ